MVQNPMHEHLEVSHRRLFIRLHSWNWLLSLSLYVNLVWAFEHSETHLYLESILRKYQQHIEEVPFHGTTRGKSIWTLRMHDTFTLKMTMNKTFDHFQCSTLIPKQDRPHKVYISLKLRAFWMHSQQEKRIRAHFELQQYFESGVYHTLKGQMSPNFRM